MRVSVCGPFLPVISNESCKIIADVVDLIRDETQAVAGVKYS